MSSAAVVIGALTVKFKLSSNVTLMPFSFLILSLGMVDQNLVTNTTKELYYLFLNILKLPAGSYEIFFPCI